MFVIFPKQNISEDKSSYFFFTFYFMSRTPEKVSPLSKNASLRARIYIGHQPNIQHEEMLFNVIRHKQFSTYKMEL